MQKHALPFGTARMVRGGWQESLHFSVIGIRSTTSSGVCKVLGHLQASTSVIITSASRHAIFKSSASTLNSEQTAQMQVRISSERSKPKPLSPWTLSLEALAASGLKTISVFYEASGGPRAVCSLEALLSRRVLQRVCVCA